MGMRGHGDESQMINDSCTDARNIASVLMTIDQPPKMR